MLGIVVTDHLFERFPELPEGQLAKTRAAVVSASTLAEVGIELGVGLELRLGKGEDASGGRQKASIVADAVEAVLGARAERLLYNLTSAFGSARDLYEPTGLASSSSSRRVPPNPSEAEHERATDRLLANFFNRKVA